MDLNISQRVSNMKASATLAMAQAARELADAGVDVKILSAGEPDFNTPVSICQKAKDSIDAGKVHYAPVRGNKNMIAAMQEKFLRDQGVSYQSDEVMCTVGAKSAIMMALDALINPGDEVIIFAPYWVSYLEQIRLSGGVPVIVNCSLAHNFMPTAADLKKALSHKTKAIILNSPNNPSGGVISREQLSDLAALLAGSGVWIISDEIYEKILFDASKHYSPAAINSDMRKRTIVISGTSKAYAMTGWRVGVVAANSTIISAMSNLQGQQTTCLPEFIQDAAAFALRENTEVSEAIRTMNQAYLERRDACLERFKKINSIKIFKPQGAFYLWADCSAILGAEIKDDIDLASILLKEAHVACVAGTPFGARGFLRLSIASALGEIEQAIDRIERWLIKRYH